MSIFYFVDDARDGRFDCFMYVVVGEKAVDGSLADLSLFGHLIEGHLVEASIAKQMLHCIHYFLFFVSLLQLMTSHRILTSQFWLLFDALSGKGWKRIYDHPQKRHFSLEWFHVPCKRSNGRNVWFSVPARFLGQQGPESIGTVPSRNDG